MDYNVDFDLQAARLLPTMLRKSKIRAVLKAMLKPISYMHQLTALYMTGAIDYTFWDASYIITPGQRVKRHGKLYENTSGVNQNGPDPVSSPELYTQLIPDWRGVKRRIRYNAQLAILEFVLNEWFNLYYAQPDYEADEDIYHSDIYITRQDEADSFFVVFEDLERSSAVYESIALCEDAVFEDTTVDTETIWDVKVWYPASEISGTELSPDAKFKELKALVDQYMVYGTKVVYQQY